jgi:hypothetical protein
MGEPLNTYLAFFNGREREFKAASALAAQRLAVESFKPRAGQKHMVHVHLIAIGDKPITISTASL